MPKQTPQAKKAPSKGPEVQTYILVRGKHTAREKGEGGASRAKIVYTVGDELELTPAQAKGLVGKVKLKGAVDEELAAAKAARDAKGLAKENEGLKDQMANLQKEISDLKEKLGENS